MKFSLKYLLIFLAALIYLSVCSGGVFANAPYEASDLLGQFDKNGNRSFTSNTNQSQVPANDVFNGPTDVAIDVVDHRLYVVDTGNNRVLVFNLDSSNELIDHVADYILGQADYSTNTGDLNAKGFSGPQGIALNTNTHLLYVSDYSNNRILVFNTSNLSNNMDASYVIGQADFITPGGGVTSKRFYNPIGLAIDNSTNFLYLSDYGNHRVLVFDTTTIASDMDASYVLGQADFTSNTHDVNAKGFYGPWGISINTSTHLLYVADYVNSRVLVFDASSLSNNMDASYVLGQADFTTSTSDLNAKGFNTPKNLVVDSVHNFLYVSDNSSRVLVFNTASISDNMDASYVIGQTNFTSNSGGASASTFGGYNGGPYGLTINPTSQLLYVLDKYANRALIFDTTSIANGMSATDVMGQDDVDGNPIFTTSYINGVQTPNNLGFYWNGNGSGTAIDTIHHRLFVSDGGNYRIMIFNLDDNNNLIDHTADYVFETGNYDYMDYPGGLAYDSVNDRLFVADLYDLCRVLVFDLSGGITNDMDASYVIGYDDFSSYECTISQSRFGGTYYGGLAYDEVAERLYVEDTYTNYRVLVFDVAPELIHNGMDASYVIGAADFDTPGSGDCTQNEISYTYNGIVVDPNTHKLFISSYNCYSVYVFDTSNLSNGMNASYILGWTDFTYNEQSTGQAFLYEPEGLAYDRTRQILYVFDYGWYRIVAFNLSGGITNGMDAIGVIGQPDFASSNSGTSQTALYFDYVGNGAVDEENHRLYFPDDYNNRMMIFDFVVLATNSTLTSGTTGVSYSQTLASQFQGSTSWTVDSGSLPTGLTLTTDGKLAGTPTTAGSYSFTLTVHDDNGAIGYFLDTASYTITIAQGSNGTTTSSPKPEGEYSTTEAPVCNMPTPDGVPTLFQVNRAGSVATLHFTPITANTSSYFISYGQDTNAEGYSLEIPQPSDTSGMITQTIEALPTTQSFYYKVQAKNSCRSSVWSEIKNDTNKTIISSLSPTGEQQLDTTSPASIITQTTNNKKPKNMYETHNESPTQNKQTSQTNPPWYLRLWNWFTSFLHK